jgi:hypothetical protein
MEGKDNENSADLRNHNPITTTKAGRQLILYHDFRKTFVGTGEEGRRIPLQPPLTVLVVFNCASNVLPYTCLQIKISLIFLGEYYNVSQT